MDEKDRCRTVAVDRSRGHDAQMAYVNGRNVENDEAALVYFTTAVTLAPKKAVYHAARGGCYRKLGRAEEAFYDYVTAIQLRPKKALYYSGRSDALLELSRPLLALEDAKTACSLAPTCASFHLQLATIFHHSLKRLHEGAAAYGECLKLAGRHDRRTILHCLEERGACLFQLGNYAEAAADFKRASTLETTSAELKHQNGRALWRLGRITAAEAAFSEALTLNEDLHPCLFDRGVLFSESGRRTEAMADLSRAIRMSDGRVPKYFIYRARVRASLALRHDGAVRRSGDMHASGEEDDVEALALADIQEALRAAPDNAEFQLICGMLLARMGRHAEALDSFARVLGRTFDFSDGSEAIRPTLPLGLSPGGSSPDARPSGDGHEAVEPDLQLCQFEAAKCLMHLGQPQQALVLSDRLLKGSQPGTPLPLARSLAACETPSSASRAPAAGTAPAASVDVEEDTRVRKRSLSTGTIGAFDDSKVLELRGRARLALGFQAVAVSDFTAALALDDSLSEALLRRGVALVCLGRNQEAEADFSRCLELENLNSGCEAAKSRSDTVQGMASSAGRKSSRCSVLAAECHHTRGRLLLQQPRRLQEALCDFNTAVAACNEEGGPNLWQRLWHRAVCLVKVGDATAAIRDMEKAATIVERHGELEFWLLLYHIGLAHLHMGLPAESLPWFDRALSVPPPHLRLGTYASGATRALMSNKAYTSPFKALGGCRDAAYSSDFTLNTVEDAAECAALHYHRGLALLLCGSGGGSTNASGGNSDLLQGANLGNADDMTSESERAFSRALLLSLPEQQLQVACLKERARARQFLGRLREAESDLRAAIVFAPEDPWARFQRAWVRKGRRNFEDAASDFEEARRLQPKEFALVVDYANIGGLDAVWPSSAPVLSPLLGC